MVDITVVNWTFDSESDSLVLFRKDAHDHDFSVKLDKDAIAYFDSEKLPCMFEFFNISKVFRTDQIHHDDIEKIRFNISITRKYVEVRMELNPFQCITKTLFLYSMTKWSFDTSLKKG